MNYLEDILELAKKYKKAETDEEIEGYVREYGHKFWLYITDGNNLRGYCDFFIVDKETVVIYDIICEGRLTDMWAYCRKEMARLGLNKIQFKREKYGDKYRTYRRK